MPREVTFQALTSQRKTMLQKKVLSKEEKSDSKGTPDHSRSMLNGKKNYSLSFTPCKGLNSGNINSTTPHKHDNMS